MHEFIAQLRGASAVDAAGWLWRAGRAHVTRPFSGAAFSAPSVHTLDTALLSILAHDEASARHRLVVTEDSAGHEISRAAEVRFESRFLAHHAAVLAHWRERGHGLAGLLTGVGHSAAFFVNALQAPRLDALPGARVVAMDPAAVARVTGLDVAALIEGDPLLGQPVRHLAALGGIDAIVAADEAARNILDGDR